MNTRSANLKARGTRHTYSTVERAWSSRASASSPRRVVRRQSTRLSAEDLSKSAKTCVEALEPPQKRRKVSQVDSSESVDTLVEGAASRRPARDTKTKASATSADHRPGSMRRQNGKGAKDIQADSEAPAYSRTAVKPSYGPPGKASESRLKRWEESLRKTEEKLDSRKRKLDDLENAAKDARADLNKRQKDVAKQERELARAQKQLEKQQLAIAEKESAVAKQEQETQDLALALSTSRAEQLIAQLEEHFFCSLCFEIIACPCTIGSSRCGHTFCALCIMKWYFSRLCPDCCTWHEDLECPLCRTPIAAPKVVPADGNTPCPFAPNRMVDGAVAELLNTIRNESTASSGSSSTSPKGKGKGKSKKTEGGVISEAIALWGEGGASRVDWQDRNRRGHAELDRLTTGWTRMGPGDYKLMKNRLAAT